jgi:hypothetical protein
MQLIKLMNTWLSVRFGAVGWEPEPSDESDVIAFNKREFPEVVFSFAAILGVHGDRFSNYPSLGVVHAETSALNRRFLGLKNSSVNTAMVGTTLLGLAPEAGDGLAPITRWGANDPAGVDAACAALVDDVNAYGLPFLRSFPTLDACIAHVLTIKRYPALNQHLAIALALEGRMTEALPILAEYAAKAAEQRIPLSTQTQTFVRNFIEYFDLPRDIVTFDVESN